MPVLTYRHLVASSWDLSFLSNPQFVVWLDSQFQVAPLRPGEQLVDYVRVRVQQQKAGLPPAVAPAPQPQVHPPPQPSLAMNGSTSNGHVDGFDDDMLDLTSYAGDEPSASNGFGAFSASSSGVDAAAAYPVSSAPNAHLFSAFAASPSPTPSPMSAYRQQSPFPGAFSGPITPFTPGASTVGGAPSYGSTLDLQAQLISQERQRSQQQQQQQAALLGTTSASAFFNPQAAYQQQQHAQMVQQQPAMTITPTALSAQPAATPTSSSSAAAAASTSKPAKKPRSASPSASTSSSSASKRARTASPPADSYDSTHWTTLLTTKVRPLLTSKRIQSAAVSSAQSLVKTLQLFSHTERGSTLSPWGDASDVPPEGRAEVLTAIVKYAREDYYRAWLDCGKEAAPSGSSAKGKEKEKDKAAGSADAVKSDGLELLQRWLEGASRPYQSSAGKDEKPKKESAAKEKKRRELEQASLFYILQVLTKLPVSISHLMSYKVATLVLRISKKANEGAVKANATQLYTKWKKMQEEAQAAAATASSSSTAATKRKSDAAEVPVKKIKTTTSSAPAAPAPKPVLPIKEKVALPSFSKKKEASNPFAAAMANLKKKDDPAPSASSSSSAAATVPAPVPLPTVKKLAPSAASAALKPKSASPAPVPAAAAARPVTLGKNGKPKKVVRWKPDEELEMVREIEAREVPNKGGVEEEGDARNMDAQEGVSLGMHLDQEMDEEIEYYPPVALEIPETDDFQPFHNAPPETAELRAQTEREAATPAFNFSTSTPPDSPSEPPADAATATAPGLVAEPKSMHLAANLANDEAVQQTIAHAQALAPASGVFAANDELSSILGGLQAAVPLPGQQQQQQQQQQHYPDQQAAPPIVDEAALHALRNFAPEQVEQVLRSNPQFQGMSMEQLGMAPHAHAQPPVHDQHQYGNGGFQGQHGQHYPPPGQDGYNPGPSYSQPWQPPPTAAYVPPNQSAPGAWQPPAPNFLPAHQQQQPHHHPNSYNGYVPPGTTAGSTTQTITTGGIATTGQWKGRKRVACRFWKTPRGCDRGDMCAFRHDV
ncbi:hypothetical protein JCM8097_003966 [Rhodosporidiobolus ruineniae]